MKDVFISHNWGKDTLGRDNHKRCKELADKLIDKGYNVWFDSYDLYGNIDSNIIKGINNCSIIIICLTKKYCDKINTSAYTLHLNDNCYKEWNYTLFKQKIIIPVIMEPCMIDIFLNGDGIIQMYLNSIMFMDFSNNIEDDFEILCKTLKHNNIFTNDEKKFYKGNSNSFNNFVQAITGLSLRSLSPRTMLKLNKKFYKEKKINNKSILKNKTKWNNKLYRIFGIIKKKKSVKYLFSSNKNNCKINI